MKFDIYLKRCVFAGLLLVMLGAWRVMDTANSELKGLRSTVLAEVDKQTSMALAVTSAQVDKQSAAVLKEVAVTRRALLDEVDKQAIAGFQRIDVGLTKIDATIAEVDTIKVTLDKKADAALSLADRHATTIEAGAAKVSAPVANIADQVKEQLPLILDCDHNPDCIFNRYVGVAKGVEQAAVAIGKSAPSFTATAVETEKHIDAIAADAHKVADKFVAPATVWDRMKSIFEYVLLLAGRFI